MSFEGITKVMNTTRNVMNVFCYQATRLNISIFMFTTIPLMVCLRVQLYSFSFDCKHSYHLFYGVTA